MAQKPSAHLVGIVVKPSQPRALEIALQLIQWLETRKISYLLDADSAPSVLGKNATASNYATRAQFSSRCTVIVVLGGDGTLISVAHYPSANPPIILGVNLGTLGFLTELTPEDLIPALESTLTGTAKTSTRQLLRATVERAGEPPQELYALNDVVISKEAIARIFGVEVQIAGDLAALLRGDGVIVSSPCGSTGYSLAAGGAIVHPNVQALLVTPICAHSLTSRPLVVPGSSEVVLTVAPLSADEVAHVYLTVDGQQGMALRIGDRVRILTSEHYVRFVHSPNRSYYQLLSAKLKWANT